MRTGLDCRHIALRDHASLIIKSAECFIHARGIVGPQGLAIDFKLARCIVLEFNGAIANSNLIGREKQWHGICHVHGLFVRFFDPKQPSNHPRPGIGDVVTGSSMTASVDHPNLVRQLNLTLHLAPFREHTPF